MSTLPPDVLIAGLRAQASGGYGAEAAAELLIAHGTWLGRRDFDEQLVEHEIDHIYRTVRQGDRWRAECRCGWQSPRHRDPDAVGDDGSDHLDDPDRDTQARPDAPIYVWVNWPAVPAFATAAPCSTTEANILRLAAELVDVDSGVPLGLLLSGLDDRNTRLVADAIDHVLSRGGRR